MSESAISDSLKYAFHERCLDMVRNGVGQVAIDTHTTIEATAVEEEGLTDFARGFYTRDEFGQRVVIWTDLLLDPSGNLTKHVETEYIDRYFRPVRAGKEIMQQYLSEELREAHPDIPQPLLARYVRQLTPHEALNMLKVRAVDIETAISTMDALLERYDLSQ